MKKIYEFKKSGENSNFKSGSKDSKRKRLIRLMALFGALLMFGTVIISLISYII